MITKLIDKIHDLEEKRDEYNYIGDELNGAIVQSKIDVLKEFLVEQFKINLDDPQTTDETWLRMATAQEDNRPVLCEISYQNGHSVASDGYRLHMVRRNTEHAKDAEQLHEVGLKFPDVSFIWKQDETIILRLRPEYFIDALNGLVDDDYDGIFMAIGKSDQPVLLWNDRTHRKACFMPMHLPDDISIPDLE